jgi:hypothetical protein
MALLALLLQLLALLLLCWTPPAVAAPALQHLLAQHPVVLSCLQHQQEQQQ